VEGGGGHSSWRIIPEKEADTQGRKKKKKKKTASGWRGGEERRGRVSMAVKDELLIWKTEGGMRLSEERGYHAHEE